MISVGKKWNDPYCDLIGLKGMIRFVTFVMKLMPITVIQS